MLRRKNAEPDRKGCSKKMLPLILVGMIALLAFQFTRLDESKKRFIMHLLKQAPYLPGRYYA
jgi:hypothetical protein